MYVTPETSIKREVTPGDPKGVQVPVRVPRGVVREEGDNCVVMRDGDYSY